MTNEEYDDARQIWALTHASNDFELVSDACQDLLTVHTDHESPIYRALLTSAYIAYGRTFKGKKGLVIDENLVPVEHRQLHEQMIELRDKIYAHNDAKEMPLADRFHINRVTIVRHALGARGIFADKIQALPKTIQQMKDLAAGMRRIVEDERDRLLTKHESKIPMGEPHYLNVTDMSGPFALPAA